MTISDRLILLLLLSQHNEHMIHTDVNVVFSPLLSSGPQKCTACIKEDLFEEPVSILKQGGVSTFSFIHFHVYLIIRIHIFSLYITISSSVWPRLIFLS